MLRTPFWISLVLAAGCGDSGSPTVPVAADSPWPKFRADARQTGRVDIAPTPGDAAPWAFQTGKGIFSSPVIGGDGTIYVGSADRWFYAIAADGTLRWKVETGEIIDSSALLDDRGRVYFGSGDGHLRALDAATGAAVWDFAADAPGGALNPSAIINWFEGNVTLGPDGTLYAGNDNFLFYGLDRETGTATWKSKVPDQTWSAAAVDPASGAIYVGNNSLLSVLGANLLSFDGKGGDRWRQRAWDGTIAASPMIARDGSIVVGGFDGVVRSLVPATGEVTWEFATRDHIYASPAEAADGTIIQPSADGTIYALDPATGTQRWAFDTLEPIRSSPAIDADGNIYVGSGEGRLFVLDKDGTLRWSMRLIDADRNDLNASPALGKDAIIIAGESGAVFSVPYDYCLGAAGLADARCATGGEDLPSDGAVLRYTTGLGAPLATPPATIDANAPLVLSLFVRVAGDTQLALIDSSTVTVDVEPAAATRVEVSGDRRFLAITPDAGFAAGSVSVHVHGDYLVGLVREGLVFTGGTKGGSFDQTFAFAVRADDPTAMPLAAPALVGDPATTWELSRLAAPLPTMLPSYNQIGFDSLHYLVGLVEPHVAWVIGASLTPAGVAVPDPTTKGVFALGVDYRGGALTLDNSAGFSLEAMGATLTFERFRVATRLDATGATTTAPQLGVSTICSDIQLYGPFVAMLGLCNPQTNLLLVSGGVLLTPHPTPPVAANALGAVTWSVDGAQLRATVAQTAIRPDTHAVGILLVDAATGAAVSTSYGLATTRTTKADGSLASVTLTLSGTEPKSVRAYLMIDTYPAAQATLALP